MGTVLPAALAADASSNCPRPYGAFLRSCTGCTVGANCIMTCRWCLRDRGRGHRPRQTCNLQDCHALSNMDGYLVCGDLEDHSRGLRRCQGGVLTGTQTGVSPVADAFRTSPCLKVEPDRSLEDWTLCKDYLALPLRRPNCTGKPQIVPQHIHYVGRHAGECCAQHMPSTPYPPAHIHIPPKRRQARLRRAHPSRA